MEQIKDPLNSSKIQHSDSVTLFIISSECLTSSNSVSPTAVLMTGTRAGRVDSSKSFLSYHIRKCSKDILNYKENNKRHN